MTSHYTEKRNFDRLAINHEMTYVLDGADIFDQEPDHGLCRNLSAYGILFSSYKNIDPGTIVNINISPRQSLIVPLEARVEVIRTTKSESDNRFEIAGIIKVMN
jgi:hypothetical protein